MATFAETKIGQMSFVVTRQNATATVSIMGGSGTTETADGVEVRSVSLDSTPTLSVENQQKLNDLAALVEDLLGTVAGI